MERENGKRFLTLKRGQAMLAFILLVGGIVIEIAVAGALVTYYLSSGVLGDRLSSQALAVAFAGIEDAQMTIARDKDFGDREYDFFIDKNVRAEMVVSREENKDFFKYTIIATGINRNRQRVLMSELIVNKKTGTLRPISLKELYD